MKRKVTHNLRMVGGIPVTSSGAYFEISVSLLRIIFRQENGLR